MYSEGKGSIFSIYLPAIEYTEDVCVEPEEILPTGNEKILLIDDEPLLLLSHQNN